MQPSDRPARSTRARRPHSARTARAAARGPIGGAVAFVPVTPARAPHTPFRPAVLWPPAREAARAFTTALRRRVGGGDELDEARELLAYWERRARRLPRWALVRRREARYHARLWRERVSDAERLRYGRGLLGAASLYATEGRVPVVAAHRGRQMVRIAAWTAVGLAVSVLVVVAATLVALAQIALSVL
jgi:hypothetical protein